MSRVIYLWSLGATLPEDAPVASLETAQLLSCGVVLHIVQALAYAPWPHLPRLWLVTRGAQAVEVKPSHLMVAQAPLWGLGRVVSNEHPELWGGLVDLDPEAPPGEDSMLFEEVWTPDGENQLAFRSGRRCVARLVRGSALTTSQQPFRFRTDSSYLITGGLGDLGLQVARWMVEHGARRLILMGRTELPPRSTWNQLEEGSPLVGRITSIRALEAMGASIHLASVDVADEAQLSSFLQEYYREGWPPIRGVVHAAGVVQDQLLLRMDTAMFNLVLRPKILGAWLLHRLLKMVPLDFFVLFSSIASLLGSIGQGNYAAGNAFMDVLAHYRRAQGLPALSINWGPWAQVGMAARLSLRERDAQRELQFFKTISPEQGLQTLDWLLRQDSAQIAIMPFDGQQRGSYSFGGSRLLLSGLFEGETTIATSTDPLPKENNLVHELLLLADPTERRLRLQSHLQELIAGVLRIDCSHLDPGQPLLTLGMDSIMAVELKNRIEVNLGVTIPMVDLLQGPSISGLADQLASQLFDDERIAELLAEVEQLSLDETQALLADKIWPINGGKSSE